MLAIRLQRTGRRGHPMYRLVVQEARRSPLSGSIVAQLGHYNPHTKETVLNKEIATKYLSNGAQPSPRVVAMLKSEGVKLPEWVDQSDSKKRAIRNPDKLRRNRPAVEAPAAAPEATAEVTPEEVAA